MWEHYSGSESESEADDQQVDDPLVPALRCLRLNKFSMPQVRYIYPERSDGVTEVRKGKQLEPNAPSAEQMKKTQKSEGALWTWYEEVSVDDPKYHDWCRKLGGILVKVIGEDLKKAGQNVGDLPNQNEYAFASLPKNYRLFEHVRQQDLDNPGGAKDRRDTYLYGHPAGPKKRFRSPGDFASHLRWLGSDPEFDHDKCSCKLCTSDETVRAGTELAKMQQEDLGSTPEFAKTMELNKDKSSKGASSKVASKKQAKAAAKAKEAARLAEAEAGVEAESEEEEEEDEVAPPLADPTPLPLPVNLQQINDLKPGGPVFRPGELVWRDQPEGGMGLGVLISVKDPPEAPLAPTMPPSTLHQDTTTWLYQPLSSPVDPQAPTIVKDSELSPFLSYSLPRANNEVLNDSSSHFDNIKWNELPADENRIVDGSIFAAIDIDRSYTLVQALTPPNTPTMEFEYNGLFLGGEMIWVGDVVRYQANTKSARKNTGMLVVHKIINRLHTGSTPAEVLLVGDVYQWRKWAKAMDPPPSSLPLRMQESIQQAQVYRKMKDPNMPLAVVYVDSQVRVPLDHIGGRFYEPLPLIERIRPQVFHEHREEFPTPGELLNPRGSKLPPGNVGIRKNERLDAYRDAVPIASHPYLNFHSSTPHPAHNASGATFVQMDITGSGSDFVQTDPTDEAGYGIGL